MTLIRTKTQMKFLLLILLLVVAIGCSGDGCDVAPVSGVITIGGKPIEGVKVKMFPVAIDGSKTVKGKMASGITDAQGRYSLVLADNNARSGATVGINRVVLSTLVTKRNPDDPAGAYLIVVPEMIPKKFTSLRHTSLQFEVPTTGTDQANFELSKNRTVLNVH